MSELRPYQRETIDALFDYWASGGGNPLVDLATGTGKSVVIATLVRELLHHWPDMRILMLVHVRELVAQNATEMLGLWPDAPLGINSAGLGRRDDHSRILFASVQSVYRRAARIGPRDLILIDEAHLVPQDGDGMYRKLIADLREMTPDLRVAGFTATPYRMDSGRLDKGKERLFDRVVYSYGIGDGVRDEYLSPLISKATLTSLDVSGVARRGGEFVESELQAAVDREDITAAAVQEIIELGADRRSWLVFCAGVDHAHHVRDEMVAQGVTCEAVTGETPASQRDAIVAGFKAGRIRCLTNAMVLTTGFNVPQVDLIAMLRPTLSTGLYVQICGRGTRRADGKANCLVLDFAGNVRRHGPVDAIRVAYGEKGGSAADQEQISVRVDTVQAKECPECRTLVGLATKECPTCSYQWPQEMPRHAPKADAEAQIMSGAPQAAPNPWIAVTSVSFSRHEKFGDPDAPPTMRVDYVCGFKAHSEWVCFEHTGFARAKAERWWREMRGLNPVPADVEEALLRANGEELAQPSDIVVKQEGKFFRVIGRRFTDAEKARTHAGRQPLRVATSPNAHWSAVLGVSRNADREEIRMAFRRLSKENHPDRGGSHDAMANINRAYEDARKAGRLY